MVGATGRRGAPNANPSSHAMTFCSCRVMRRVWCRTPSCIVDPTFLFSLVLHIRNSSSNVQSSWGYRHWPSPTATVSTESFVSLKLHALLRCRQSSESNCGVTGFLGLSHLVTLCSSPMAPQGMRDCHVPSVRHNSPVRRTHQRRMCHRLPMR